MSLPQNLLALCETMLPGENQRGRPDAATLKRSISFFLAGVAVGRAHQEKSLITPDTPSSPHRPGG
jgi:hypothetical protein